MRTVLMLLFVIGGFALQAVSYFFLAAPLDLATNEAFSNPRVPFAAGLFILGVMLVFLGAVVYELVPGKRR
ncbi:MAG: hypothetical protein ACE5IZ_11580 [Dehalococcoidia bacterium]